MGVDVNEWVWLRHPTTGGVQHAPPTAVQTWLNLGWEPIDAPAEPNPALAEYEVPVPTQAVDMAEHLGDDEDPEEAESDSTEEGDE